MTARPDVLAIGVAGSWAHADTWPHSDLDIEVVLRGEHDFLLTIREEGEVGVDVAFFGENILQYLPYETRPIYDPHLVMTRELASRDLSEVLSTILGEGLNRCQNLLRRAEEALPVDPRSTLVFLHLCAWSLSEVLTVAAGDNRTIMRRCSRLERAVEKHNRYDLLERCGQFFGFPDTLTHSRELLAHLQAGYREIWGFFKDKTIGHPYMIQQPDSELWFHNRIEPVHQNDPRDSVWIVYVEFPDTTWMLFRNLTERERLPPDMFREAEAFPEIPKRWVKRHLECLGFFTPRFAERLLPLAVDLVKDAREFVDKKLYVR